MLKHPLCLALLFGLIACEKEPPARQPPARDRLELRLATFNIRHENPSDHGWRSWPRRIGRVVRAVRDMDPDVLALQEALYGQAADLRASLPDYHFHGVGRDDGHRQGEYAALMFKADRFDPDPEEQGTFWLSDTPDVPGSKHWGNDVVRCTTWLRLVDRTSGLGFYAYNTHWDHRHQGSREQAAALLVRHLDQRRHPDEPVILMGDFNATHHNPAVARLTAAGLIETYHSLHPQIRDRRTLHFWSGRHDGGLKVDHILVSGHPNIAAATIHRAATRDQQPSDHFPVSADVRWQAPPPDESGWLTAP
jgi:endonuclease/exonuclease/phosphatase family metal-dependent hydrolase